jgi:hypothetical protein
VITHQKKNKNNYFFISLTALGQGDSGGPQQVVHSTRTGFGFSFVLHTVPKDPCFYLPLHYCRSATFKAMRYSAQLLDERWIFLNLYCIKCS